jgi:hypothetical protein
VILVTAGARRLATFRIEALDGSGMREHAVAGVTGNFDEKPGDGFYIRGRNGDGNFADDAAAIVGLPGRSGEMFADELIPNVEELGVGSFQGPVGLPASTFANINLVASGVNLQKKFFVDGGLERLRNLLLLILCALLRGKSDCAKKSSGGKKREGCDRANVVAHGVIPFWRVAVRCEVQLYPAQPGKCREGLAAEMLGQEICQELIGFIGFGKRRIIPESVGQGFEDDELRVNSGAKISAVQDGGAAQENVASAGDEKSGRKSGQRKPERGRGS